MQVEIPDELAQQLIASAKATGVDPTEVVVAAVRRELAATHSIDETLRPVRDAFKESKLTEDEAVDLFEAEKHALRRERREAS
jgi:hypothetical protein